MNNILDKNYVLSNGVEIPSFALGTWQIENELASNVVEYAINVGYNHIDTAVTYGNEVGVAKGIENSKKDREEIFITTKIPAQIKNYEEAKQCIEDSLKRLNTDYIDLMIIHAPKPWDEMSEDFKDRYHEGNLEVWRALEEAYTDGKLKSIGVSNFNIEDLKNIIDNGKIKPMVNQICFFIGNSNMDIINFCREEQIVIMAYSPLGTGSILNNDKIIEMANKYGVTPAQLCVRFTYQLNLVALPKSIKEERIIENAEIDFEISTEDMSILFAI